MDTGQLIAGHYRLVEYIGSGASGVVWRAIDERLERSVAVKKILTQPGLPDSDKGMVRQRAMREAKNAARFQHPNAIVVFDVAEDGGDPCLVMEYLPSRSLSGLLSMQGPLPLDQVARIGEQVAAALVAAHRVGIVHRDVKPGNILIDEDGVAKITDFGISRATGDLTLTETGLICGTPAYLAPEVAKGADTSPASDVFALGATLYHALEGQPPYGTSTNQLAVLYNAAHAQLVLPKRSGKATALLLSLMRAEPEQRPSMAEAQVRLAALAEEAPTEASTRILAPSDESSPPHPPTATFEPTPEPTFFDPGLPPRRTSDSKSQAGRGKRIVLGVAGLAGLALTGGVVANLVLSGQDSPNSTTTVTRTLMAPGPSSAPSATTAAAALGQTKSSGGKIEYGPAGMLIQNFYSNPGGSWNMLTPAAQQVYGSQEGLRQYWASEPSPSFSGIDAAHNNNADGSVDMRLASLTHNGQTKSLVLRVVDSNGTLLIDSDTR